MLHCLPAFRAASSPAAFGMMITQRQARIAQRLHGGDCCTNHGFTRPTRKIWPTTTLDTTVLGEQEAFFIYVKCNLNPPQLL